MSELVQGTTVRIRCGLTVDEAPVSGTNVTLTVRDPAGGQTTPTVATDGTGSYHADLVVPLAGQWHYEWEAENPATVGAGIFVVRRSLVN